MLPDEALVSIFKFCTNGQEEGGPQQVWQTLVRVCPRWRYLVFGSPRSLNLQLICTPQTPARDMLDIWPPLPLVIGPVWCHGDDENENVDNIVAALERRNRVCQINIKGISRSNLEIVLAAMQESFPELTSLTLSGWYDPWNDILMEVLPDSFLGGSAPRLRTLDLLAIPFPGLPKLLLSATHLTNLRLHFIPNSGYISPEAMATALSSLGSLGQLHFGFPSLSTLPDRASRRPPPPKRFVLPVLTEFSFEGASEYVDDLVARIDAPRLIKLGLDFFSQVLSDTPELIQFISRTSALKAPEIARIIFEDCIASIKLLSRASDYGSLGVRIVCEDTDWQVLSMEQVCTRCLPPLSTLEDLYISDNPHRGSYWGDNIENSLWQELLLPFIAVKNLYLSREFALRIMPSLKELIGEGSTEVLPTLRNIFLEGLETSGPVQKAVQQFVATRQASQPITISHWDRRRDSSLFDDL